MSHAIVKIIYGVPLTEMAGYLMQEWERSGDERWTDGCGFTELYSASLPFPIGYCGVELDELPPYIPCNTETLQFMPNAEQYSKARKLVDSLDPALRDLCGDEGIYFIWSDA